MPKPIYLDYNATTPHDPQVIEAMRLTTGRRTTEEDIDTAVQVICEAVNTKKN